MFTLKNYLTLVAFLFILLLLGGLPVFVLVWDLPKAYYWVGLLRLWGFLSILGAVVMLGCNIYSKRKNK